ncbi:zinc finger HIT domain-containing protein 3 isoform X2 [Vidua macroura]|uniref:zinc finger HIT domain-containing protein 3 isoform X2 n=1 Tax=Vidua macroura TaxID=187451 RepID=UPI0023A8D169|nr:zinc finger HIT domain-containing protein 3 isoform X2 [Vidua macroura]
MKFHENPQSDDVLTFITHHPTAAVFRDFFPLEKTRCARRWIKRAWLAALDWQPWRAEKRKRKRKRRARPCGPRGRARSAGRGARPGTAVRAAAALKRCAPDARREREAAGQGPLPGPAAGAPEDIPSEEEEQDRVPPQRLQLLGESEELRELLRNPHLRQLLLALERARDKSSVLRQLMQEPLFVEFADCCLRIVEPPEEKENVLPE